MRLIRGPLVALGAIASLTLGAAAIYAFTVDRVDTPESDRAVIADVRVTVPDIVSGRTALVKVPIAVRGGPLRIVGSAGSCNRYCCLDLAAEPPFDLPPSADHIECEIKANEPGAYSIPLTVYAAGLTTTAFEVTVSGVVVQKTPAD